MFCRNMLCCRIIFFNVPSLDSDWIPYGMNLKFEFPSLNIFYSRFLNMFALLGDVLISYAKVVIRSFPLPSPISLLYKSKAGMTIFCCPVSFPELSFIW